MRFSKAFMLFIILIFLVGFAFFTVLLNPGVFINYGEGVSGVDLYITILAHIIPVVLIIILLSAVIYYIFNKANIR